MKSPILQGIAIGLAVIMGSLLTISSLFYTRTEANTLHARVVSNEGIVRTQLDRLHEKIDNLKDLIIKLER